MYEPARPPACLLCAWVWAWVQGVVFDITKGKQFYGPDGERLAPAAAGCLCHAHAWPAEGHARCMQCAANHAPVCLLHDALHWSDWCGLALLWLPAAWRTLH